MLELPCNGTEIEFVIEEEDLKFISTLPLNQFGFWAIENKGLKSTRKQRISEIFVFCFLFFVFHNLFLILGQY